MSADPGRKYDYKDDADHDAYIGSHLRRQRSMIYFLGGALLVLIVLSIAGYDFDLGSLLDQNDNTNQQDADNETPPPVIDTTYWPALSFEEELPEFQAPLKLLDQKNAEVAQGLCVVATHTGSLKGDAKLPKERAWLARITSDLGIALCDNNRVLDASLPQRAQAMLARFSLPLDQRELRRLHRSTGTRNLIVVEFTDDASKWTLRGSAYDSTEKGLPPAISRTWPNDNTLETLRGDITKMASLLTSYALSNEGVFEVSDTTARQYALYLDALHKGQMEADSYCQALRQEAPQFEFPIYRRIAKLINPSKPEDIFVAMNMLNEYVKQGGNDKRLLNLFSSTASLSKSYQEEAYAIAEQQVRDDRLNMAAYTSLINLEDAVRKLRGKAGIRQEALYSQAIEDYPRDGRYHTALAKTLYIDPATVDRAVEVAQQAYELRPWSSDTLYHVGFALLNHASSHENDWPQHQVDRVYRSAANVFERVWLSNPNLLDFRLEMWLKALTHEHKHLPTSYHDQLVAYAMAKALVYVVNSGSAAIVFDLYSPDQTKAFDLNITALAESENTEDQRLDLFLLADIAAKNHALSHATSLENGKVKAHTLKRSLDRYRRLGGRASHIEDILENANNVIDFKPE